ncbi:MAG: LysM peptidoglycan-binding domain-containing protein [Myxococcales bacterium]|nr:LysM peptidoglycan-binding domain-containing protein [Myxococcales bacterium]
MRRRTLALLVAASASLSLGGLAQANRGFQHVVRDGETLASIAERYYGDPRREVVLVTENGLTAQGGSPIVVGLRLQIPHVAYHRVRPGETWPELATRFYGDPRRAFVLIEANHASQSEQPAEGTELLVPYPLRHVSGQRDTVTTVAKAYYGNNPEAPRRLRRFNDLRTNRLNRGQIVLIPLDDLVLSEEGRNIIADRVGAPPPAGEVRQLQAQIESELPPLGEHVRRGRYTEAVALGNRLLGTQQLTGNQIVTIQRHLGTAYVALGRDDLATQAFLAALQRQPDLQLDTIRTSPRVMQAFERARDAAQRAARPGTNDEGEAPADAGAP